MFKAIGAAVLLSVSFLIAYFGISTGEPPSIAATAVRPQRDPAAIRRVYDFSGLDGQDLSSASKKRLISGFDVIKESAALGVSLGHFVVMSPDGQKQFACDRYSSIILSFEGEGMAVNGDKPMMEVEGVCTVDNDINRISPLWIPVAKLMQHPVADGDYNFMNDAEKVLLHFKNVADQWPSQWVLTKVRLKNSANQDEVNIDRGDLRAMMDRPMVLDFISR